MTKPVLGNFIKTGIFCVISKMMSLIVDELGFIERDEFTNFDCHVFIM